MNWRMTAALAASFLTIAPIAFSNDGDDARRIQDLEKQVQELRTLVETFRKAPNPAQSDLDRAIADLAARFEQAAAARGGQNVSAPGVKSVKLRFEDRFRGEFYSNRDFGAPKLDIFDPSSYASNVSPLNPDGAFGFFDSVLGPGEPASDDGTPSFGGGSTFALSDASRILNRLRISLDVDVNDRLAAFFQLQQSRLWGTAFGEPASGSLLPNAPSNLMVAPPPAFPVNGGGTDPDVSAASGSSVSFKQAFIVAKNLFDSGANLTMGRMNLDLGRQRLLSSADWDNVGRAFDGVRLDYVSGDDFKVTGFASKVVQGGLDFHHMDTNLLGAWAEFSPTPEVKLTPYTLWLDNNTTSVTLSAAQIGKPWTIGVYGEVDLADTGVRLDGEFATQQDRNRPRTMVKGAEDIEFFEAIMWAANAMYQLPVDEFRPWVGVEVGQGTRQFNDLYGARHGLYGIADVVTSLNNLTYWKFYAGFEPYKDIRAGVDFYTFRSTNAAARLQGSGIIAPSEHIGEELDFWARVQCTENITVQAGWAHFFNGYALQEGGYSPGAAYVTVLTSSHHFNRDADFFYISAEVTF